MTSVLHIQLAFGHGIKSIETTNHPQEPNDNQEAEVTLSDSLTLHSQKKLQAILGVGRLIDMPEHRCTPI